MFSIRFLGSPFLLLILFSLTTCYKKDHGFGYLFKHDPNMKQREKAEKLTNDRIRGALSGMGSAGLFSDPFPIHDIQTKFSGANMYFTGARLYGLDRARPLQINADFTNLMVSLTLSMDQLNLLGNFKMTPWVAKAEGPFNFTIVDAWLTLEAELMFLNEGSDDEALSVSDILKTEFTYDELQLTLDNIGILNTILQPVKSSLAKFIVNQMKGTLCNEAELNFRNLMNQILPSLPKECPNAVNVVDRALIRARKSMKTSLLDPLLLPDDYPKTTKFIKLELIQGKLFGLSGIRRTGPILVGFERNAVHMLLNLGVENLRGQYVWTWTLWKNLLSHRGVLNFIVHDISIKVKLERRLGGSQENTTQVETIDMKVGSVKLLSDGIGAVKYIMETFLNVVPDSFRQKITDAAEYRILKVIEEKISQIDLEQLVEDETSGSMEESA
ncbi:hypothetical protein Ocin01_02485 [Orchesella cincta]|uniref:Uncharacterized protein n=1 Tax=Orchesella cincta TaxID=48709 RepID=A0A1D2NFZ5_ORCCI|nr:hypothetical protein Ocin01_02485 [Orchesella cincta]